MQKPTLAVGNLIVGSMYFDMSGTVKGMNKTTGDVIELTFTPKTWRTERAIKGTVKDKTGKVCYTLSGSWLNEIFIEDAHGKKSSFWKFDKPIPDAVR